MVRPVYRLQSDEERNSYMNQLYGGSPPSMDYYAQLGAQKRMNEDARKAAEKRAKEEEKEEEKQSLNELIAEVNQSNAKKQQQETKPVAEKDDGKRGFFDTLGGMASNTASNIGFGLSNIGKLLVPGGDGMDEVREATRLRNEENEQDQGYKDMRNFAHSAAGGATFGGLQNPEYVEDGGINIAGQLAGSIVPGAGIVRALQGTRAAANFGAGASRTTKALQRGKEGMTAGSIYGGLDAGASELRDPEERDFGDHVKNIAMETAFGGILDPALGGLMDMMPRAGRSVRDRMNTNDPTQAQTEPLPDEVINSRVSRQSEPLPRMPREPLTQSPSSRNVLSDSMMPELPNALNRRTNMLPQVETSARASNPLSELMETRPELQHNMQRQLEIENEIGSLQQQSSLLEPDAPNSLDIPDQIQARDTMLAGLGEEFEQLNPNRITRGQDNTPGIRSAEAQRAEMQAEYEDMKQAFVDEGRAPYTNEEEIAHALSEWETVKQQRQEFKEIKQRISKFRVPEQYKEEYAGLFPKSMINNKSSIDVFDVASELGYEGTHNDVLEMGNYLRSLQESTTKTKKSLVPEPRTPAEEMQEIDNMLEQTFPGTDNGTAMQSMIDAYSKQIDDLMATHSPNSVSGIDIEGTASVSNPLVDLGIPKAPEAPTNVRAYDGGNQNIDAANTNQSITDRVLRQVSDDLQPIRKTEKIIGDTEIKLGDKAQLSRGAGGAAEVYAKKNIIPVVENFTKSGEDLRKGMDFVYAKHLNDVAKKNPDYKLPGGMNYEQTVRDIAKYEGKPEYENLAKGFQKIQNDMLDIMEESELITPKLRKELNEKFPNYMPLFRQKGIDGMDAFYNQVQKLKSGNVNKFLHELEDGGADLVKDPIEVITQYITNTHNAAFNNRAMKEITKLNDLHIDGKLVARKIGDKNRKKYRDENIVQFFENGNKVEYYVNDDINQALTSLKGVMHGNQAFKLIENVAKFQRQSITANPFFSIRQIFRDIPQAWVVGDFSIIKDLPVAMLDTMFDGKFTGNLKDEFMKHGGGMSNLVSMDRSPFEALQRASNSLKKDTGTIEIAKDKTEGAFRQVLEKVRNFNEALENVPKVAQYNATIRKAQKAGNPIDREQAALAGRDIMDFAMSGEGVRHVNRMAAFINANIRGKEKQLRALKERKFATSAKMFVAGAIPTVAAHQAVTHLASDEQKNIVNEAPEWLRQTYWLVPSPLNDKDVWRIPKPYEVAMLASTPVEFLLNQTDKVGTDGNDMLQEWMKQMLVVDPSLNPLTPLFELKANTDTFTGQAIVPDAEKGLPASEQGDVNTASSARMLSSFTGGNISPRIMQHLMEGFSPVSGEAVNNVIDAGLEGLGVRENQKPAGSVDVPLIDDFLIRGDGYQANTLIGNAHDTQQELQGTKSRTQQEGVPFEHHNAYQAIRGVQTADSDMAGQMRSIANDPNLSAEEKRDRRNAIAAERNQNVRGANNAGMFNTEGSNLDRLEQDFSSLGAESNRTDQLTMIKGQLVRAGIPEVDAQAVLDQAKEAELSNVEIAELIRNLLQGR